MKLTLDEALSLLRADALKHVEVPGGLLTQARDLVVDAAAQVVQRWNDEVAPLGSAENPFEVRRFQDYYPGDIKTVSDLTYGVFSTRHYRLIGNAELTLPGVPEGIVNVWPGDTMIFMTDIGGKRHRLLTIIYGRNNPAYRPK